MNSVVINYIIDRNGDKLTENMIVNQLFLDDPIDLDDGRYVLENITFYVENGKLKSLFANEVHPGQLTLFD